MVKNEMHKTPLDVQKAIDSNLKAKETWESTTPIARSDWICWIISGKKAETRDIRIEKMISMLKSGKRRVCCFSGCIHRLKQ